MAQNPSPEPLEEGCEFVQVERGPSPEPHPWESARLTKRSTRSSPPWSGPWLPRPGVPRFSPSPSLFTLERSSAALLKEGGSRLGVRDPGSLGFGRAPHERANPERLQPAGSRDAVSGAGADAGPVREVPEGSAGRWRTLTQKMKLNPKSRYLMHLEPPLTGMVQAGRACSRTGGT